MASDKNSNRGRGDSTQGHVTSLSPSRGRDFPISMEDQGKTRNWSMGDDARDHSDEKHGRVKCRIADRNLIRKKSGKTS